MKESKRYDWIDVAKAIGIILVVIGHVMTKYTYFWRVIQQFHMPLFFVISGYLFKLSSSISFKDWIIKKVKHLWLPFVLVNGISVFIKNSSILDIIKKLIKVVLMLDTQWLFGATWFLQVLMYVSVFNYVLLFYFKKKNKNINEQLFLCIIAIFSVILGNLTSISHHISTTFIAEFYFVLGYLIKVNTIEKKIFSQKIFQKIITFLLGIVLLSVISVFNNVSFAENRYDYFGLFVLSSLSGVYCTFIISYLIRDSKILKYIGKKTMVVLMWQFVAFKFVILMQIFYYRLDIDVISSYPYYSNEGFWGILLIIFGVSLPILFSMMLNNIFDQIKLRYNRLKMLIN